MDCSLFGHGEFASDVFQVSSNLNSRIEKQRRRFPYFRRTTVLHFSKHKEMLCRIISRRASTLCSPTSSLTGQQLEIAQLARSFADKEFAPSMLDWDKNQTFPADALKKAASLGLAAIYCKEQRGGSSMSRVEASLVFEGLSTGCVSTTSYLSIHNMCAWMIDTFGSEVSHQILRLLGATRKVYSKYG
jgi:hypothetical protein